MPLDLNKLLGDKSRDIECPNCSRPFKVELKKLFQKGSVVHCPHCNASISFEQLPETTKAIDRVNSALKDLEKTIKKFNR